MKAKLYIPLLLEAASCCAAPALEKPSPEVEWIGCSGAYWWIASYTEENFYSRRSGAHSVWHREERHYSASGTATSIVRKSAGYWNNPDECGAAQTWATGTNHWQTTAFSAWGSCNWQARPSFGIDAELCQINDVRFHTNNPWLDVDQLKRTVTATVGMHIPGSGPKRTYRLVVCAYPGDRVGDELLCWPWPERARVRVWGQPLRYVSGDNCGHVLFTASPGDNITITLASGEPWLFFDFELEEMAR